MRSARNQRDAVAAITRGAVTATVRYDWEWKNGQEIEGVLRGRRSGWLIDLDLNQCNITDAGLVHFRSLKSLECLDLSKARITDAGVVQATSSRPSSPDRDTARPMHCRAERGGDFFEFIARQPHLVCRQVFFEVFYSLRAGNRHDVFSLREHPRERELARSAAFLGRESSNLLDHFNIFLEVFALKSRGASSVIVAGQVLGFLERSCQESAA